MGKGRSVALTAAAGITALLPVPLAGADRPALSFAARLAEGADPPSAPSLMAAMRSHPGDLQAARWAYARAMLAAGRGPEALAALRVMRSAEPALALVPRWRRAAAAAHLASGQPDAVSGLLPRGDGTVGAAADCALRLLAADGLAAADVAVLAADFACAAPPATAAARLAHARTALRLGRLDRAAALLALLADGDPAANLLRAELARVQQRPVAARLRAERALAAQANLPPRRGDGGVGLRARLLLLRLDHAAGKTPAPAVLTALDRLEFAHRGLPGSGDVLDFSEQLARDSGDHDRLVRLLAARLRMAGPGAADAPRRAELLALLGRGLTDAAPLSAPALVAAADRLWRVRDLVPPGGPGAELARGLARQLAAAGLWARAAELTEFQLLGLPRDAMRGPVVNRAAALWLRAGDPARAAALLDDHRAIAMPGELMAEAQRLRAFALGRMGQGDAALALVADDPAARAALAWRLRRWDIVGAADAAGPVRRAIALASAGDDAGLARLAARPGGTGPARAAIAALNQPADPAAAAATLAALDAGGGDGFDALWPADQRK